MPSLRASDPALQALSPEDAELFVRFGFGVTQEVPFGCVHHAFEHHVASQPNAVAVEHCGDGMSYAELETKANGLAGRLRSEGVVPGTRVCLLAQRSIPMVIGILAILKAGGAYVPLDGVIVTQSTLEHVVHDSEAVLVLCMQEFLSRVTDFTAVCLEAALDDLSEEDCVKPNDLSSPDDSIYIIYTSGMPCFFNIPKAYIIYL